MMTYAKSYMVPNWGRIATVSDTQTYLCIVLFHGRSLDSFLFHDDVIKWKHFPRNWPFVRKIHRSPVNFPHKGQWRGALMFSLIYVWINDWANNREAGDLRRQHGHYDVIVMYIGCRTQCKQCKVASWGWVGGLKLLEFAPCIKQSICINALNYS